MLTLPPELILPFAATICAGAAMIVLGLHSKLLQRYRRVCPSCGRFIEGLRCGCAD